MKAIVTGAAGFIGSNLTDRLLRDGYKVRGVDNLSTGRLEFLRNARACSNFELCEADLLDAEGLLPLFEGFDTVFHLAANADVRFGPDHPQKDLEQNTIATANVLEAMRQTGVRRIAFSSSAENTFRPGIGRAGYGFPEPAMILSPVGGRHSLTSGSGCPCRISTSKRISTSYVRHCLTCRLFPFKKSKSCTGKAIWAPS